MAAARISEETVLKAANALLKWKKKLQSAHEEDDDHQVEETDDTDDFIYLSLTLKKVPPPSLLALTPHRIPLRHSLLPPDHNINLCLIVDGKKITSESARKTLKTQGIPIATRVLKLAKLKTDYKSFDSKKKLYDSFDLFFAAKNVVPLLPQVLGKVFYKKKRKIPVPVELRADGSNWKEEIEMACGSSLLCLSSGTCSAVRVGRWGVTREAKEIVDNVFEAVGELLRIVPKKWGGIRCLHLKFSGSLALPIYDYESALPLPDDNRVVVAGDDDGVGLLDGRKKRKRGEDEKKRR